ncbi:hypothetical protein J6590_007933 [Homalodisca vitripennis]|nr:hypothetical protein J6590_007933 [Homalodisca vitripennis]
MQLQEYINAQTGRNAPMKRVTLLQQSQETEGGRDLQRYHLDMKSAPRGLMMGRNSKKLAGEVIIKKYGWIGEGGGPFAPGSAKAFRSRGRSWLLGHPQSSLVHLGRNNFCRVLMFF